MNKSVNKCIDMKYGTCSLAVPPYLSLCQTTADALALRDAMVRLLGLTGPIACGKSSVSELLAESGSTAVGWLDMGHIFFKYLNKYMYIQYMYTCLHVSIIYVYMFTCIYIHICIYMIYVYMYIMYIYKAYVSMHTSMNIYQ